MISQNNICKNFIYNGSNFQTISVEQKFIDIHKYHTVFILVTRYRVFGDYKLLKAV